MTSLFRARRSAHGGWRALGTKCRGERAAGIGVRQNVRHTRERLGAPVTAGSRIEADPNDKADLAALGFSQSSDLRRRGIRLPRLRCRRPPNAVPS